MFSETVQTGSGVHSASHSMNTGVPSRGYSGRDREADHSPPPRTELKNEWSHTSAPPVCFMAWNGNFSFTLSALNGGRVLICAVRGSHSTVLRRLTTGIRSEKCVVRRFRRCAKVIDCTYTNLDSIANYTPRLYGIAYRS